MLLFASCVSQGKCLISQTLSSLIYEMDTVKSYSLLLGFEGPQGGLAWYQALRRYSRNHPSACLNIISHVFNDGDGEIEGGTLGANLGFGPCVSCLLL